MPDPKEQEITLLYVGTYTTAKSGGIYVYRLDPSTGVMKYVSRAVVKNPSFLVISPDQQFLFSVGVFDRNQGGVFSFSICPQTGELIPLNSVSAKGRGPCHLSVDSTGKYVFVANYGDGSVAMFPVQNDGQLSEASSFIKHQGSSVNPRRQKGPHAHSITIDPGNHFAFAADLGLDKVMIYKLDLKQGKLVANESPFAKVAPGAGPRHFDFHQSGKFAYVINEMNSTLTAFTYDAAAGKLSEIQTVPTLPADFKGRNSCADIHVHPNGKFLYGSNRGHNSIVIFAIDQQTGRLTLVGHESTKGEIPRNFGIDPTGKILLAANQKTNNIFSFHIDPGTGKLKATGHSIDVGAPVCVKFIRRPAK